MFPHYGLLAYCNKDRVIGTLVFDDRYRSPSGYGGSSMEDMLCDLKGQQSGRKDGS